MARKAVNGYPDKSYYDNTVFKGIVATGDPLNEGSFALLTNLDITDSGKSVLPRKGYITTTFAVDDTPVVLSNKVLLYRDPNIQKDIIIDLAKVGDNDNDYAFAYKVDITQYNLDNNVLADGHLIEHYDVGDLLAHMTKSVDLSEKSNKLQYLFNNSTIVGNTLLTPIRDPMSITTYITKMYFECGGQSKNYWLKIFYRQTGSSVGGVTYAPDTLVISVVDMSEQTENFINRNLASSVSIIPEPIRTQEIEAGLDTQPTDVARPMLLKIDDKYCTEKIPDASKLNVGDIELVPSFHLQHPSKLLPEGDSDNPAWAYRFSVTNSDPDATIKLHKTPWRTLLPQNVVSTGSSEYPNPIIERLDLAAYENVEKETYTYYVTTDNQNLNLYIGTPPPESGELEYPPYVGDHKNIESFAQVEADIYSDMRVYEENPTKSTGYSMNLLDAFRYYSTNISKLITNVTSLSITKSTDFRFITQDDVHEQALSLFERDHNTLADRVVSFPDPETFPDLGGYAVDARVTSAPMIAFESSEFDKACLNATKFLEHFKVKSVTHQIKFVFVPFRASVVWKANAEDETGTTIVYATSIAGIYVNGIKNATEEV